MSFRKNESQQLSIFDAFPNWLWTMKKWQRMTKMKKQSIAQAVGTWYTEDAYLWRSGCLTERRNQDGKRISQKKRQEMVFRNWKDFISMYCVIPTRQIFWQMAHCRKMCRNFSDTPVSTQQWMCMLTQRGNPRKPPDGCWIRSPDKGFPL